MLRTYSTNVRERVLCGAKVVCSPGVVRLGQSASRCLPRMSTLDTHNGRTRGLPASGTARTLRGAGCSVSLLSFSRQTDLHRQALHSGCLVDLGLPIWAARREARQICDTFATTSNRRQTLPPSDPVHHVPHHSLFLHNQFILPGARVHFTDRCQAEGFPRFAMRPSGVGILGFSISCVDLSRQSPMPSVHFLPHFNCHICVGPVPNHFIPFLIWLFASYYYRAGPRSEPFNLCLLSNPFSSLQRK